MYGYSQTAGTPQIALFVRPDIFGRTVSCLIYIPRDRYDTRLRIRLAA